MTGNNKRKLSDKAEKKLAKKVGGKVIAGSGCGRYKGDVKAGIFNFDNKTFEIPRKCFSLAKDKFYKHYKDSKNQGQVGVFHIEFDDNHKVIVMDENDFFERIFENDN